MWARSATTPHGNALATTFGLGNFTNGYGTDGATGKDDLGSARHYLFLGTNQAETHPVTFDYLLRGRKKTKATLTVVDPRLTPTGAAADRWVAPKPHTDFALLLGMLHHIVEEGLYDKAFVGRWVVGFDELRAHLAKHQYTPAWAAKVTGIPAATITAMAEEYASAKLPRSSATRASPTSSAPSTPTGYSRSWPRSRATSVARAAAATSCTTPGPATCTCRPLRRTCPRCARPCRSARTTSPSPS